MEQLAKLHSLINCPNPTTLNSGVFVIRPKNENIDNRFFYYLLMSFYFDKFLAKITAGSTITHLYQKDFVTFNFILPTKAEQTAIAKALSDADALINSLEKLIAKKRSIKQGAMQKLLKPKKGWETKTLKELARYRRGSFPQPYGLDKWYDDTNGLPFVQVFDVDDNFRLKSDTKRRISKEAQAMSVYIEKGSVVITLQGSIGRIAITQYDAYVDRTLLFFESFIVPFDKYFFLLSIFSLFEKEKEKAPGGIIKTITKEALSSFTISYPKIEEQNYIASILSDIDADIKTLEVKLEKYRKVKLGMMQNLLTGKIRLV
jgi:type I restriction enzyme S subunit